MRLSTSSREGPGDFDMADLEEIEAELPYPGTNSKLARNIGLFMAAWGVLERELDNMMPVIFHTDPTLACCIYANLGTKAKLDMLASAITMHEEVLGPRLTKRAHSTIEEIRDLSERARNTIAHGQVTMFYKEKPGKIAWELVRQVARKSHAMVIYPGNALHWGRQEKKTLKLAQKWRIIVRDVYLKTGHMTLADLDRVCGTQTKVGETRHPKRRSRPPQSRGGWHGRQASRGKWPRQ